MSESQKWRPPVAPKPTLHSGNAREHEQSAALRGATLAFKPPAPKPTGATGPKPTGRGALDAATAANKLGRQEQQQGTDIRNARSPVRGRSQLSLDLQRAVDHTSSTSSRNPLHRTASEIAARAASASSSPARSHPASSRPSSPQRQRSLSRESSLSHRSQLPSDTDTRDALRGATLSMSASPSNGTASPFSNKAGKLDFQKIPSLAQQPTRPAAVQRQPLPKAQSKAPAAGAPPSTEAMEMSKAPPPPPKRQTKKRNTHDTQDYVDSPKSVTTPTVTLSEPDDTPAQVAGASGPHKMSSKPIPVPRRQAVRTSPPANASPSPSEWSPRSHRGSMTAHNLADAMVGASLASSRQGSRAASPAKHKPPPMPRRRSKSVDLFRPHLTGEKAPPLKPLAKRPMKHTLRKHSPEHEEEDETKRGRKHLIRKHPHMHNEGDRKRWRDKISERERKRYEGVWASNRGFLHEHESIPLLNKRPPDSNTEDLVLNVVVRDIWNRSRLPHDVLEEIWDLVSPEPDYRALTRERFVVGMWLVDQRLKGRKLPVKVSASVWQSARHMGIKVSSKPF